MTTLFSKIFDSNEKQVRKAKPFIDKVNAYEDTVKKMSDEELLQQTVEFRKRLGVDLKTARNMDDIFITGNKEKYRKKLEKEKKDLEKLLVEAFAVVREASRRITNHRHFDVQLMAGYFLFQNRIVEVFTGEGKTLSANLALYMYALTGKGAHLVTVNDYLARRDAEWNGHIFNALGITVGVINNGKQFRYVSDEEAIQLKGDSAREKIEKRKKIAEKTGFLKYDHMDGTNLIECSKKEAYDCDIVYGTNNEFGFDYLRDNMAMSLSERVQGPLHFAIVDEADSILIDEARTPLIISQSATPSNDLYKKFAELVNHLERDVDYEVDEKAQSVILNDKGIEKAEKLLKVNNLYENAVYAYHLDNALKAKELYHLDDQYIIRNGEILIVDEFTGRVLPGRRYSEGLHQAIEAKEGVEIKRESKTLATITLQNYFRLYDFLSGMTGTALTEAEEFSRIYHLDTIVVPTNKPVIRKDHEDLVFKNMRGKLKAIVKDIEEHYKKGQPVLVGTTSVEKSEVLSELLKKKGIPHNVLNAKNHQEEAKIVAKAGQKGAVTIATNMAGRGTDIALGEGVKELGGLYVIGTERHESRRIDNQLRGRSGRQGDPGKSRFYVSFEDDLMRIYGGDKVTNLMDKLGLDEDLPVSNKMLGKTIESAQKKVEAHNFDIRKQLVDYDDVLNQQREIIYGLRRRILYLIENSSVQNVKSFGDTEKVSFEEVKDFISTLNFDDIVSQLDGFYLNNSDTWNVKPLSSFHSVGTPINMWVLQKLVNWVRYQVALQYADDKKLDDKEERKMMEIFSAMLNEELMEMTAKALGYKDVIEFFRTFDKTEGEGEKEALLLKFLISAFVIHVIAVGPYAMREFMRYLVLQSVDEFWKEHLNAMRDLREGIWLRNVAQKDPLVEYKNEGFRLFEEMINSIDNTIMTRLFKVKPASKADPSKDDKKEENEQPVLLKKPVVIKGKKKPGRNDPCPCGSGKKYKKCCYPKYG